MVDLSSRSLDRRFGNRPRRLKWSQGTNRLIRHGNPEFIPGCRIRPLWKCRRTRELVRGVNPAGNWDQLRAERRMIILPNEADRDTGRASKMGIPNPVVQSGLLPLDLRVTPALNFCITPMFRPIKNRRPTLWVQEEPEEQLLTRSPCPSIMEDGFGKKGFSPPSRSSCWSASASPLVLDSTGRYVSSWGRVPVLKSFPIHRHP